MDKNLKNQILVGRINYLNREAGFGFITPVEVTLESDCFFHANSGTWLDCNFRDLLKDDIVEFQCKESDKSTSKARYIATEIRLMQGTEVSSIGAYTRKGGGHDFNEDEFFVSELMGGERVVCAVADGLSNPRDTGWWASSEVMTFFVTEIYKSNLSKDRTPLKNGPKERKQQVRGLLNDVQANFKKRQKEMTDNRRQAKSTLTFFVCESDFFVCGSAGDSYLLKADITGKHYPIYQVGSKEERLSSIVQSAVGEKDPSWHPNVLSNELGKKEALVLCTDGIIIDSLRRFITANLPPQKIAESLVDHSIQESGRDDATCILLSWKSRMGA